MAYSPVLGQWLTRDPAGYVDGADLYDYVGSNPVAAVDPFGLFKPAIHTQITQDGLAKTGLVAKHIAAIVEGNINQDQRPASKEDHGDNGPAGITLTIETMSKRWKDIFDGRGKCETCEDVLVFLKEFGKILHAIQDLYSHSNYVEVSNKAAGGNAAPGNLPLWDMTGGPNHAPAIPAGVTSGTFSILRMWDTGPGTHAAMAHDDPTFPASKVANQNGSTMFDLAKDLATRHTAAAWAELSRQLAGSQLMAMLDKCATQPDPATRPVKAPATRPGGELLGDK